MSHTIYAGSVSKRRNSTLQPTLNTSFDVLLKTPTSLHEPTFSISAASFPYNYLKWGDRYYFVKDVVAKNNSLFEVSCKVDVLATFKAEILNTVAYILYASVNNSELVDNRIPMKTTKSVQTATAACPLVLDGGCYILSLTGAHGTTGVYKVTETELGNLIDDMQYILDDIFSVYNNPPAQPTYTNDIADNIKIAANYFVEDLKWRLDCLRKPITQLFGSGSIPQNIRECRFIPFNIGTTAGTNPIYLGTFETQQSLSKLVTDTVVRSASVSIPWQSSDYRRRSPYTELYIYVPYIGMIKLSSENLVGETSINVDYAISVRDGSMICTLSSGGEVLGQYAGNVSVSVPVGISNLNAANVAQSIITGAAAVATKNIGVIGLSALNFAESVQPNYSCIGGLDGLAGIATPQNITCYTVYHDTIANPNTQLAAIGAPYMRPAQLSSFTDYVQCLDAHVSAAAELEELEELDNFLNSGIYIE